MSHKTDCIDHDLKQCNAETIEAIEESQQSSTHKRYQSFSDIREEEGV